MKVTRISKEDVWMAAETTALLLLDHNEDFEPCPRGLWGKIWSLMFQKSLSCLFFVLLRVLFFPAATRTMCSRFVERRSLLVYLYEYVVVGHVARMSVCMLEGYVHVR